MIPTSRTPRPHQTPIHAKARLPRDRFLFGLAAGPIAAPLLAILALLSSGCASSGPVSSARASDPPPAATPSERADRTLPNYLTIDPTEPVHIRVEWTTASGERVGHKSDRLFLSPGDHTPIGGNLSAFASLGGKRLEKGAGHPLGAIVRVGFYKVDNDRPLFEDIDPTSPVTITCSNIRFDRPVDIHHDSGIHHSMYDHMKIMAYGMSMKAMDTHNLVSTTDTLNERVVFGKDARPGALAPGSPLGGGFTIAEQPDGSYTLAATLPYPLFRHIKDDGTLPEPIKDMNHETMIRMMEEEMQGMSKSDERPDGTAPMNTPGTNNMNHSPNMPNMPGMHGMGDATHAPAHRPLGPDGLPMTDPAMPGGFFEPFHFHLEFEAVPKGAKPHTPARTVLPTES